MGAFASTRRPVAGSARACKLRARSGLLLTPAMTREMLFALALGYLLGSIPFGLILTRLAGKGDIREIGSGNIGATNVLRTGSKPLAALTLILDCLKATAAIVLARLLFGFEAQAFAAAGAFLGHLYPVWLKFRGGKGAATVLGVLIGLLWPAARLRGCLDPPASDDPNLVSRGNECRHQRADRCRRPSFVLLPNA